MSIRARSDLVEQEFVIRFLNFSPVIPLDLSLLAPDCGTGVGELLLAAARRTQTIGESIGGHAFSCFTVLSKGDLVRKKGSSKRPFARTNVRVAAVEAAVLAKHLVVIQALNSVVDTSRFSHRLSFPARLWVRLNPG
jgi:hypothetical protein